VPYVCDIRQDRSSSTSYNPSSECNDTLDSVLRTSLWPDDPEFYQLACRRVAWWDSDRVRSWLLEKGYTLYLRSPSEDDYEAGMHPVNPEHKEHIFPFANHEGVEPDGKFPPPLYGHTGCVVCMNLLRRITLNVIFRATLLLLKIPKDNTWLSRQS
ncbi:hypothetical protein C0995_011414, partial [Termitomyces sp. Mi166